MLKLKKLRMPMPSTINDCLLLWKMGCRTEVNDGEYITVAEEKYGDDIKIGDEVRIINSGHIGKVDFIGQNGHGLGISGAFGLYAPWEVEKVDKKGS